MARPGGAAHEHTVVIDTVNDFFPHSSISLGIFGLQRDVISYGSQHAQPDIDENNPMTKSEPRPVPSTVLPRVNRDSETMSIVGRISTYHVRTDCAVDVTTIPGEPSARDVVGIVS